MPNSKNYWIISRPKRQLILVPDLLKIFSAVASGETWKGNRDIQADFEAQLVTAQWKAQNTSVSASGGRTYANLLFLLGLWFEDENGVQITNAGLEIIEDNPPVPILTKQLMDFQYPSPYSLKRNVNISSEYNIQPHRFVMKLFLDKDLQEITQEEIGFCLVPFAKSNADLDKCHDLINKYRENPEEVIEAAKQESGTTEDNLKNIGNTVVNQLEYTGWFEGRDDIKSLTIKPNGKEKAQEFLSNLRTGLIGNPEDTATFQMRYGSGFQISKDYRYTQPAPAAINPNERAILLSYYEIALNEPIEGITEELINRIAQRRGVSSRLVRQVLSTFAEKPLMDRFEEKYLQLATGGTETATDFEIKTNGVFSSEGFGFTSVWVGSHPRYPDLFVYFDRVNKKHGLIDTKAYREYPLPLDHKNIMAHTYIPNFREIEFEGENYTLAFYAYVAGGYSSSIQNSFNELVSMTDIPGSYITAYNLLRLLRLHRQNEITPEKFAEIFTCNKEVKYEDIQSN